MAIGACVVYKEGLLANELLKVVCRVKEGGTTASTGTAGGGGGTVRT